LSRFWQRRIYEVVFSLSLAIIILYTIPIFSSQPAAGLFDISLFVVIGAAISALTSLALYILSFKVTRVFFPLIAYLLFSLTTGLLIAETGLASSPFLALWMLVAFFSGLFLIWGVLPVVLASAVYVAAEYLDGGLTPSVLAFATFVSIVPAIISLLIWRQQDSVDESTKNVKKLTNELSEIANKSEIVINAIGDGVIAVDSVGVIQLMNPAAQAILGWGKQDALMLNYKSVLQLLDANNKELDPSQDPIAQVLNTNQQVRSKTLTLQTKSAKKIMSSLVVTPIGDSGSGVIAVFRDITKEKAEEREQAEFISTASHEMRTPVASIEGYLGLALNPNTSTIDDKARGFIMKAHEAAEHLGHLFQDLLDVSKSEDGRMTNTPKVVNLTDFAETITEGLRTKAAEKSLTLTFVPSNQRAQKTIAPVFFVSQDNDHIREVLENLIENAIKYTPKGSVTVDISGTDDKAVVSVKDSGLGIPPEDVPHLFQKFYRVDTADRQAIGGTGLGLYLSRRLVEAMEGRLWVESVYGQGSTFFFELPRITNEEAERLKTQQATQAAQTTPAQPAEFVPNAPPVSAPPAGTPVAPSGASAAPVAQSTPTQAATTVPRGESLSREQIAAHVRQLQALARGNQTAPARPESAPQQRPTNPPETP
jgi:PAS domain S-box-containing protein